MAKPQVQTQPQPADLASDLEKKLDQSAELAQEIRALKSKLTPQELEDLQKKQLAKMPPEQRKIAEQLQQQLQQQAAGAASPAQFFNQFLQETFQVVAIKSQNNPDLSLQDRIALANLAANGAQGYNAVLDATGKEAQIREGQKRAAAAAKLPEGRRGQYL